MKILRSAAVLLMLSASSAMAADKDPQECPGFAPPYRNSCSFPITIWYMGDSGPVKSLTLAPGRSGAEKGTGSFETVVCKHGETAYAWSGGAPGTAPWQGGGYECRK